MEVEHTQSSNGGDIVKADVVFQMLGHELEDAAKPVLGEHMSRTRGMRPGERRRHIAQQSAQLAPATRCRPKTAARGGSARISAQRMRRRHCAATRRSFRQGSARTRDGRRLPHATPHAGRNARRGDRGAARHANGRSGYLLPARRTDIARRCQVQLVCAAKGRLRAESRRIPDGKRPQCRSQGESVGTRKLARGVATKIGRKPPPRQIAARKLRRREDRIPCPFRFHVHATLAGAALKTGHPSSREAFRAEKQQFRNRRPTSGEVTGHPARAR